jgi:hypothetical protein
MCDQSMHHSLGEGPAAQSRIHGRRRCRPFQHPQQEGAQCTAGAVQLHPWFDRIVDGCLSSAVVGNSEEQNSSVNVRTRDNVVHGRTESAVARC